MILMKSYEHELLPVPSLHCVSKSVSSALLVVETWDEDPEAHRHNQQTHRQNQANVDIDYVRYIQVVVDFKKHHSTDSWYCQKPEKGDQKTKDW